MTGTWWTIRDDCFFLFFYCKANWEPLTQLAGISLSSGCETLDGAATMLHDTPRRPTNSICMKYRGLIRPSAPVHNLLHGVSWRNKRLEKVKLFISICVLEISCLRPPEGPSQGAESHYSQKHEDLMLSIVCWTVTGWFMNDSLTPATRPFPCFWRRANRGENQASVHLHKLQKSREKTAIKGSYSQVLLL